METDFTRRRGVIHQKISIRKILNEKGHIARYNVRLVENGYEQEQWADYDNKFALVVPSSLSQMFFERFISKEWRVHHGHIS